ncbi:MAG: hypothetical protein ABJO71_11740, partial [Pseudoruegeria sp.]
YSLTTVCLLKVEQAYSSNGWRFGVEEYAAHGSVRSLDDKIVACRLRHLAFQKFQSRSHGNGECGIKVVEVLIEPRVGFLNPCAVITLI